MDEEVVGMIRDNFRELNATCRDISDKIDGHIQKDEVYWKKLDQQEGQIGMLKMLGGLVGGGVAIWEGVKSLWR